MAQNIKIMVLTQILELIPIMSNYASKIGTETEIKTKNL